MKRKTNFYPADKKGSRSIKFNVKMGHRFSGKSLLNQDLNI